MIVVPSATNEAMSVKWSIRCCLASDCRRLSMSPSLPCSQFHKVVVACRPMATTETKAPMPGGVAAKTPAGGASGSYDAIVVGGGHNGLTTAAYLAKAGQKVCVLERRPILGGACVTEEVWPGKRGSP